MNRWRKELTQPRSHPTDDGVKQPSKPNGHSQNKGLVACAEYIHIKCVRRNSRKARGEDEKRNKDFKAALKFRHICLGPCAGKGGRERGWTRSGLE